MIQAIPGYPRDVPHTNSARACPRCGASYETDAAFCPLDGTALAVRTKEDPYIGTVIGKDIEIRALAGSGAMGKVYRGFQHGTGRDVAVKVLHSELLGRSQLVQRFFREAKIAGKLRHPHVVEVYFTGEIEGASPPAAYIVMEFLDGPTLNQVLLDAGGRLPIDRALSIMLQICDAVGEGHSLGIVHRDLKPENVMLLPRKDSRSRDFVKVLDFGIARAALPDESLETAQGAVFGTARYISPEGAQGLTVSPASDVYSLAVILYQMLAGKAPFDAEATVGLLLKHVHDTPPELSSIPEASGVPAEIARVVMANLAKAAESRSTDGHAFGAALVRAARGAGLSIAGADRFGEAAEATPAKNASGASEAASFVAPTLDDATPSPTKASVPPPSGRAQPKRSDKGVRVVLTLIAFAAGVAASAFVMHRMAPDLHVADANKERVQYIERTRSALTDGHYTAPPGDNVNELVAVGLKRWPNDSELRQLRSQAEQELVTMAMAARASGDLIGARNHARDAYMLDSTDNSARFMRAQLDDELKGIASGALLNSGAPRLVFEAPPVAKPGDPVEMTCRIVPGAAGAKAKVTAVKVSVLPNGQTTGAAPVTLSITDPLNVKASLAAPKKIGSYDVSFEATVDGTVVRAMRDLDISP